MSKRKQQREERRREHVEINLLAEDQERDGGAFARARRGCAIPFLGGSLLLLAFEAVRPGLG